MVPDISKPEIHSRTAAHTRRVQKHPAIQVIISAKVTRAADDAKILEAALPVRQGLQMVSQRKGALAKTRGNHPLLAPHLVQHTPAALLRPLTSTHSGTATRAAQHGMHPKGNFTA